MGGVFSTMFPEPQYKTVEIVPGLNIDFEETDKVTSVAISRILEMETPRTDRQGRNGYPEVPSQYRRYDSRTGDHASTRNVIEVVHVHFSCRHGHDHSMNFMRVNGRRFFLLPEGVARFPCGR